MARCPKGYQMQKRTGRCYVKGTLRCKNGTRKRKIQKKDTEHDIISRRCIPYTQTQTRTIRRNSDASGRNSRNSYNNNYNNEGVSEKVQTPNSMTSSKKDEIRKISPLSPRAIPKQKKKGLWSRFKRLFKRKRKKNT